MRLPHLSDEVILSRLDELARAERENLPEQLACLGEVDARKLYAKKSFDSTFAYCLEHLRFSESEAYRRIHVARAARKYLEIDSHLADGSLSLSAISKLTAHLNRENAAALLGRAVGKSMRELEVMVVELGGPRPLPPDTIRAIKVELPAPPSDAGPEAGGLPLQDAPTVETICFEYKFVATETLREALERLRDILYGKYPFGRMEDYLLEAVVDYLERHDPLRRAPKPLPAPAHDRKDARYVPRAVRNAVWARDGARCAYLDEGGRRCGCRRGLQVDHIVPVSKGGRSDDPNNLRLLCGEHNQEERRRILGEGLLPGMP